MATVNVQATEIEMAERGSSNPYLKRSENCHKVIPKGMNAKLGKTGATIVLYETIKPKRTAKLKAPNETRRRVFVAYFR
ncbi:hypothetical protein O5541_03455 [Escherichia coli]|nr:hypothetical protein [Escherichia coli]